MKGFYLGNTYGGERKCCGQGVVRYLYRTNDIARIFSVHPETVRRWFREGKLIDGDLNSLVKLYIDKGLLN